MNIQFNAANFTASENLKEYIQSRLEKLTQVFDKIVDVEVYLRLDSHQTVKDKIVEMKVHVPGHTLFSSETTKTFEESADVVIDSLKRQLKKRKEKIRNNFI